MKTIQLSGILLFCLLLVGCSMEGKTATAVPTRVAVVTNTAVPPTHTALPATDTAVPSTATISPTNTATSLPVTATSTALSAGVPTETPTITPTPLPPPPGEIYFFLDPDPSDPNTLDQRPPKSFDFYRVLPGETANEWHIEKILTGMNLAGPAITVSPDQTKLALLLLDDTDGNGKLDPIHGGDIRNIYVYDLMTNSIERLTNNEKSTLSVSWLPDSQAVTYRQSEKVFTTYLNDVVPSLVLQLSDGHVSQLIWSLSGQELFLDVNAQLTGLYVYELDSNRSNLAYETATGGVFFSGWSPDGRWLAFTHYGAQVYGKWRYVAVINKESLEVIRLVFGEDYMSSPPDWSIDGRWLAFTKNESILSLWNSETLTVTEVLSGTNMSIPVWSPLENRMAVALVEDGVAKVLTLDPQATMVMQVFQSELYQTIKLFDWSPDGEWLLLFAANEEQSGLHVVHVNSGASYQIMDTTRGEPPWELVWLPTP